MGQSLKDISCFLNKVQPPTVKRVVVHFQPSSYNLLFSAVFSHTTRQADSLFYHLCLEWKHWHFLLPPYSAVLWSSLIKWLLLKNRLRFVDRRPSLCREKKGHSDTLKAAKTQPVFHWLGSFSTMLLVMVTAKIYDGIICWPEQFPTNRLKAMRFIVQLRQSFQQFNSFQQY